MRRIWSVISLAVALHASEAVVSQPVVNMYSEATEDADVVSQAIFGTPVQILESSGGWLRIRTPDAYSGWADRSGIVVTDQTWNAPAAVTSLYAHVYRERNLIRHKPLLTLPFESRLQTGDISDDGWIEVRLPDGRSGWIQRGDVTLDLRPLDSAAMLDLSRRFLGLPYTWGGTSSFGYDCSGFTQMLLRQRGIMIPRDAHDQAGWDGVRQVARENLEPGDLLFFGPDAGRITHTGMYLGRDEFIHATAHERPVVQISRLTDEHWTKALLTARRVK
jgi:hypothetical protein